MNGSIQTVNLQFCSLLLSLIFLMIIVDTSQETPEIPLVPTRSFMLGALEPVVLYICTAVLAPVFRLLWILSAGEAQID